VSAVSPSETTFGKGTCGLGQSELEKLGDEARGIQLQLWNDRKTRWEAAERQKLKMRDAAWSRLGTTLTAKEMGVRLGNLAYDRAERVRKVHEASQGELKKLLQGQAADQQRDRAAVHERHIQEKAEASLHAARQLEVHACRSYLAALMATQRKSLLQQRDQEHETELRRKRRLKEALTKKLSEGWLKQHQKRADEVHNIHDEVSSRRRSLHAASEECKKEDLEKAKSFVKEYRARLKDGVEYGSALYQQEIISTRAAAAKEKCERRVLLLEREEVRRKRNQDYVQSIRRAPRMQGTEFEQ
jgi:hypothetical protein